MTMYDILAEQTAAAVPHRRYNPLLDEWVLVSPQRALRPWQGAVENPPVEQAPAHDPTCYLCAGNVRVGGLHNPDYRGPYVFANDFPALLKDRADQAVGSDRIFQCRPASGEARVICYSERHDLPMSRLSSESLERVVECWVKQYRELAKTYEWVAIFENKGAAMGASNPHPHGQIWASDFLPTEVAKEDSQQMRYYDDTGGVLLLDYVQREIEEQTRLVFVEGSWACIVPYWATWPFETILISTDYVADLSSLSDLQKHELALSLKRLTTIYDALFKAPFPYSMGWHGKPPRNATADHWQLHCHFYPPLLRSATVRKFMVGYELLAEAQRDLTPEQAAQRLREVDAFSAARV
jgi:UDPglucose--hexose-1-phosphate uridylyltransferase